MGTLSVWLVSLLFVISSAPPQAARTLEMSASSQTSGPEQSLARGESHDWQIQAAAGEFLVISIEPVAMRESDEWLSVTVTSPDGRLVYESTEPHLTPSID